MTFLVGVDFDDQVQLTCEATVAGQRVQSSVMVLKVVYQNPEAREAIEAELRRELVERIIKAHPPKIRVGP